MWLFILTAYAQVAESPAPLTIEDMQEVAALCPSEEACEGSVTRVSMAMMEEEGGEREHRSCAERECDAGPVIRNTRMSDVSDVVYVRDREVRDDPRDDARDDKPDDAHGGYDRDEVHRDRDNSYDHSDHSGHTDYSFRNPCSASKSDVASRAKAFVVRSFGEAGVPIGYLDSSENLILAVGPAPVPPGALKASYQVKIDLSGIPNQASRSALCSVTAEARRYLLVPPSAWKPGVDSFASKLTSDFYTAFYGQPKP